jgi:serine/threonine protein kinase
MAAMGVNRRAKSTDVTSVALNHCGIVHMWKRGCVSLQLKSKEDDPHALSRSFSSTLTGRELMNECADVLGVPRDSVVALKRVPSSGDAATWVDPDTTVESQSVHNNDTIVLIRSDTESDFTILGSIGSGASGRVLKARRKSNGQIVAIKRFLPTNKHDFPKYLTREVSALRRFSHPSILKFYGCIQSSDSTLPSIITEYLENGSVADYIFTGRRQARQLTPTCKMKVLYGTANVVALLHSFGTIHRDIKPANILLNEKWEPEIADFGLAREFSPTGMNQTRGVGTSWYIAPEAEDGPYGPPADVFAYGMMMYVVVTGTRPFGSPSDFHIKQELEKGRRPDIPKTVPEKIAKLIEACWNHNPSQRPLMSEVAAQLASGMSIPGVDLTEFQEYKERILAGHTPPVQDFQEGMRYFNGDGVDQDPALAAHYSHSCIK